MFSYSKPSRICCRQYRPLCFRTCGSCTIVHQHIFRLWCVKHLDAMYPVKLFGYGGHVVWPPISTDLNPLFFNSGTTGYRLFIRRLWICWRISQHRWFIASADIASTPGLFEQAILSRRYWLCNDLRGRNIE